MSPPRTAALAVVALVVASMVSVLLASTAGAQGEDGESIGGTLRDAEREPIPGVELTVRDDDGQEVGSATSDADGQWRVSVPGPGSYEATLDVDTLPEGMDLREGQEETEQRSVREGQDANVIYQLGEDVTVARDLLPRLLQNGLNGIKFGLIIAMAAIGLSLVFGTTGLINFAHGEMVTFGAVMAFMFNAVWPGIHLVYATVLAVASGGLLGWAMERGMFRPLRARRTGLIQLLVITVGFMFLLRHTILLFYGGGSRPYRQYALQTPMELGMIRIAPRDLAVMAVAVVVLVSVGLLLTRTRLGKAVRAVADDRDLAESSGINVQGIILLVWVLGGGLTALGGVLFGLVENVNYFMGFRLLLLMFAGVILGGLGTAYGAMIGSLVVGLITELSTIWFSTEFKLVWALGVLIIILLVRPQGILGMRERVG